MTINFPTFTPGIMKAWVNDVPIDITNVAWQSDTILRVGVTHEVLPFDELKVQLPKIDPLIFDENNNVCLGFQPISDIWPVAFGATYDSWDQKDPNKT